VTFDWHELMDVPRVVIVRSLLTNNWTPGAETDIPTYRNRLSLHSP